jgi:glycerol-3-phosphate acyltransferase PlsX
VKAIKNAVRFASDFASKRVNLKMAEKIQENFTIYSQQRDSVKD